VGGIGPPGQVIVVAGKKDGMKQGAIGVILKELGYMRIRFSNFRMLMASVRPHAKMRNLNLI
jgi:hypothetical protein